jgi:hypothetical protein
MRKVRVKHCVIALAVAAAALSAIFSAQGTLAWLNHSDSRDNEVGVIQYIFSHQVQEDFTPPGPGEKLTAGEMLEKKSWVANDGDIPAFVRVKVFPVLTAPDGLLHCEARFGAQLRYVDLRTADWMDGGDGWFYYRGVVEPGESTEPLFEDIELDQDIVADSDAVLTITIIAEAVETGKYNGGTEYRYKEAWWDNAVAGGRASVAAVLDPLATSWQ